jgi:hypothetical protein
MDFQRTEADQRLVDEILAGIEELAQTVTGPLGLFLPMVLDVVRPQVESVSPQDLRAFLAEAHQKIEGWLASTAAPALSEPAVLPAPTVAELAAICEEWGFGPEPEPEPVPAEPEPVLVEAEAEPEPEPVPAERAPAAPIALPPGLTLPDFIGGAPLHPPTPWFDPQTGELTSRIPTLADAVALSDAIDGTQDPEERAFLGSHGQTVLYCLTRGRG